MSRPGEDDLIARHFAPLAGPAGLRLLDDADCLTPRPGHDLVLTTDALVAGIHFFPDDPPASIARKALGVNLSDLAAKGADPVGYLLSLALPPGWTEDWLAAFCRGLAEASRSTGLDLLGGDTVKTPGPLTLSVTAIGAVPAGRMVRRTNARPGDVIAVTGTIGDAVLGLALCGTEHPAWTDALGPDHRAVLIDRYRHPQPRNAFAVALRAHASAAMDVSDGIAGDLAKMLRASGVTGTLALDRVPLSPAARAALAAEPDLLPRLVSGGDDYEILLTAPPAAIEALAAEAVRQGLGFAAIGEVRPGTDPLAVTRDGEPVSLASGSYQHF